MRKELERTLDFYFRCAKIYPAKAFSLVEIAVVALIASVIILVAVPVFRDILPGARIESSARRLSASVRMLYNEAVFSGSAHSLVLCLETGGYEGFREVPDSEPEIVHGAGGRLLEGVYFADVEVAGRQFAGDEARINFSPNGVIDPAVIRVENEDGRVISLVIEGFTGRVRIVEGYVREAFE